MRTFLSATAIFGLASSGLLSIGLAQSGAPATPPSDARVSNSYHLLTKDPEFQKRFLMGATAGQMGPDRDVYTLPKVLVIVDKRSPTGGAEGSIVNHVGFKVQDMQASPDDVTAQHFTIQMQNPNQAFILGPDAMQKWRVGNFGAVPSAFGQVKVATFPGVILLFGATETPVIGTKVWARALS